MDMRYKMLVIACAVTALIVCSDGNAQSFVNFESAQVHPMDMSPNGSLLAVCNTADNRVEFFNLDQNVPVPLGAIRVGLDPVSVRFRTDAELWVVNQISDSVSIIDLLTTNVRETVSTADKPADVIFAGTPERAYVSCSGTDQVMVFDPANPSSPVSVIPIAGEEPRALARSASGDEVYVAVFESGNRSTILAGGLDKVEPNLPNVVSDPTGPYAGQNPPPNDGLNFNPPIDPVLPAPPAVGLIVKKDTAGSWIDDNGGDWTDLVSGANAGNSARVPGWDILDNDIAIIDTASGTVRAYATGLMNICMAIGVNPATGGVSVVGTDATNEVRFEPNLTGTFVRVLGATIDPDTLAGQIDDLNFHLDYSSGNVPQPMRDFSLGDPRGLVWSADGQFVYVTGMGSNNLRIVDTVTPAASAVDLGEGPTGIVLDNARGQLYVLNRFSANVSIVSTATETETARVSFFDPTPAAIRVGRKHLYDTHKTSGLGQASCASCHVDARIDRLAWDLGNPAGAVTSVADQNLGMNIVGLAADIEDFHPMKGPMTTQTLQDIVGIEPFHWRGDKDGLEEFNPAFVGLLGDDVELTAQEMQEFEDFLATIHFPPNPLRNLNNTLPTDVPLPGQFASGRFADAGGLNRGDPLPNGNAQRGLRLFMGTEPPNIPLDGQINCVTCHTLPLGAGADAFLDNSSGQFFPFPVGPDGNHHAALVSVDGSTQKSIKIPHLRNMAEKAGMDLAHAGGSAGFGYLHDGSVDSLASFISSPVFSVQSDQDVADLVALMLSFTGSDFNEPQNPPFFLSEEPPSFQTSQDSHALVGTQVTADNPNPPELPLLGQMIAVASTGAVDLVVHGKKDGFPRGWLYVSGMGLDAVYQSDRAGETATGTELLALAAVGNELTTTVVPAGSGTRIGIDRDEDGILNGDETAASIEVASPSTGETFAPGDSASVIWRARGPVGNNLRILLYDAGQLVRRLQMKVDPASQLWTWDIPLSEPPGNAYAIVVYDGKVWGASGTFAIAN